MRCPRKKGRRLELLTAVVIQRSRCFTQYVRNYHGNESFPSTALSPGTLTCSIWALQTENDKCDNQRVVGVACVVLYILEKEKLSHILEQHN